MVNYGPNALDLTFAALSDPTRRAIVARLSTGETSVMKIAEPFAMSLPAVSKHLRVLERAGLISRKKDGRVHLLRLVGHPMKDASTWMARYREFWEGTLDALAAFVEQPEDTAEK